MRAARIWLALALLLGASHGARADCGLGRDAAADGRPQVLTLAEAADFLRLDGAALAEAAGRGEVPGRRLAGGWRFSRAALIAWLAGSDDPAECFEPEIAEPAAPPAESSGLARDTLGAVRGSGLGGEPSGGAKGSPAPGVRTAQDEDADAEAERFGEDPELETARELALREEAVLGRAGALEIETDIVFSRQEQSLLAPVVVGGPGVATLLAEREQETLAFVLTGRYGLSRRLQVETGLPLFRRSFETDAGGLELEDRTETEFGDVSLAARYELLQAGPGWPAMFVSTIAAVPTDGTDTFALGGGLSLIKRLDPTSLFGAVDYRHTFNAEERRTAVDDQVTVRGGFVFSMNDRLAFRTSLSGTFLPSSERDGLEVPADSFFDLGLAMPTVLTETLNIEPSVALGLDGPGSRFSIGLSVVNRFGLGRPF